MAVLTNLSVPTLAGANSLTLMPKLQYRFRVTMNFGAEGTTTGLPNEVLQITNNVISVGRPTLGFDPITIETYNSRIYMPGKHTWEAIDIIFRDDINGNVVKVLDRQLARQVDMASQSSSRTAGAFKFDTIIQTLDGTNGKAADKNVVTDEWILAGCHITNIRYGENNYGTSDAIQVSVTIRYDNAEHKVNGVDDDLLSKAGVDNFTQNFPAGINSTGAP